MHPRMTQESIERRNGIDHQEFFEIFNLCETGLD